MVEAKGGLPGKPFDLNDYTKEEVYQMFQNSVQDVETMYDLLGENERGELYEYVLNVRSTAKNLYERI